MHVESDLLEMRNVEEVIRLLGQDVQLDADVVLVDHSLGRIHDHSNFIFDFSFDQAFLG